MVILVYPNVAENISKVTSFSDCFLQRVHKIQSLCGSGMKIFLFFGREIQVAREKTLFIILEIFGSKNP